MKNIIEIKNIYKSFKIPQRKVESFVEVFKTIRHLKTNRIEVIKNLSLDIQEGDFIGIVGKNGSGKSTLLKLISQIFLPDKGDIKVNGTIVPFLELGVGFQPELSGKDNIFLNGSILGMSQKYLQDNYDEIVRFADLEDFIYLPLKNYSTGMQVRLAFSIAIKAQADIYIFDEVLAVGDLQFQNKCHNALESLKKQGKTIILVSHSLEDIKRNCNKAYCLKNGTLLGNGDIDDAIAQYTLVNTQ